MKCEVYLCDYCKNNVCTRKNVAIDSSGRCDYEWHFEDRLSYMLNANSDYYFPVLPIYRDEETKEYSIPKGISEPMKKLIIKFFDLHKELTENYKADFLDEQK